MKLTNSRIYVLSEKIQILFWLLNQCYVKSALKALFLTELLYGSKEKVADLNKHNLKYDYFGKICKFSNLNIQNLSVSINDSIICLDILNSNAIVSVDKNNICVLKEIKSIDLSYLTNKTRDGIVSVNSLSDESFLDEVLKYV